MTKLNYSITKEETTALFERFKAYNAKFMQEEYCNIFQVSSLSEVSEDDYLDKFYETIEEYIDLHGIPTTSRHDLLAHDELDAYLDEQGLSFEDIEVILDL